MLLRKIIFYILLIFYLMACPLVLLYASGYILRPGSEHGLVRTGLVSVSSVPPGASVYLGRKKFTKKTPALLMDLLPGDYTISVYLKKYRPWFRRVPVQEEQATVLEKIMLVPKELEPKVLTSESFERLIPLADTAYLILLKSRQLRDVFIYEAEKRTLHPLLLDEEDAAAFGANRFLTLHHEPGSVFAVMLIDGKTGRHFLRINLRKRKKNVKALAPLKAVGTASVHWDLDTEDHLYYEQNGDLARLDVSSGKIRPLLAQGVRGFSVLDGRIYAVTSEDVFRLDSNGQNRQTLLGDPLLTRTLFGGHDPFDVQVLPEGHLLFWNSKGELLTNRFPHKLVERGVLGLAVCQEEERVAVWQKNQIAVLDFYAKEKTKKEGFEKGVTPRWVYTRGHDIRQVFWVYDDSHLLFRDGRQAVLMDLFPYGEPAVEPLAEVDPADGMAYAESTGEMYYLDPSTDRLMALELLPKAGRMAAAFFERAKETIRPANEKSESA